MSRSKVDDLVIAALGKRRSILAAQIEAARAVPLEELQQELDELEIKLKEIDPTIPSLAEEAQSINSKESIEKR